MLSPGIRRILLVGKHFELLRKRVGALAETGAQVVLTDPDELETHVGRETFDMVVMCHSLSDLERRTVAELAHQRWPRVKVAQIYIREKELGSIGCALDDRMADHPEEIAEHALALLSGVRKTTGTQRGRNAAREADSSAA